MPGPDALNDIKRMDISRRLPLLGLLICGTAGSGKSTVAGVIARRWGLQHLQTDVIRKRLAGLEPTARTGSKLNAGIYSPTISDRLYDELGQQARRILNEGGSVILDGSFLTRSRRAAAAKAIRTTSARLVILHCCLDRDEQLRRLDLRLAAFDSISEGGAEVMASHEAAWEPLSPGEADAILHVDTNPPQSEVESDLLPKLWRVALGE
jgi:hypothetical protein